MLEYKLECECKGYTLFKTKLNQMLRIKRSLIEEEIKLALSFTNTLRMFQGFYSFW